MSPKAILVFCAQALLAQTAFSQCLGGLGVGLNGYNGLAGVGLAGTGLVGAGLAGTGLVGAGLAGAYGAGCGCGGVASTGGGLPVTSASPIAPVGISVLSENAYEGVLAAGGNLPLLGTVAIEGVLPTAGAGAVSYGCGNGAVAIGSEGPTATGILAPEAFAPAGPGNYAGLGYGHGLDGINGYGLGGINGYGLGGINGYGLGGITGCGCGARI